MMVCDSLWRVSDVARYLQASRSWVYQKAESGEMPCLRVGGLLRFNPDAIRAFAHGKTGYSAQILPINRSRSH